MSDLIEDMKKRLRELKKDKKLTIEEQQREIEEIKALLKDLSNVNVGMYQ